MGGDCRSLRVGWSLVEHGSDDLGDHVSRSLHDDGVPFSNILALDVIKVVQGRSRDCDPSDLNGLKVCNGGDVSCASNLKENAVEDCERLFSGELIGDCPPWSTCGESQLFLGFAVVDLDNHAVYSERERFPSLLDFLDKGPEFVGSSTDSGLGADGEAKVLEGSQG